MKLINLINIENLGRIDNIFVFLLSVYDPIFAYAKEPQLNQLIQEKKWDQVFQQSKLEVHTDGHVYQVST